MSRKHSVRNTATEDAPPLLKLCQEKDARSRPKSTNFFDKISGHLVCEIVDQIGFWI